MKIQEIRELIQLIDESTIQEFEFEQDGARVVLKKNTGTGGEPVAGPAFAQQAPLTESVQTAEKPVKQENESSTKAESVGEPDENVHKITSPMVGTFYTSPSPEEDVYVNVGDQVKKDTVVCIVEAMKLFNEIEAEQNGEIVEILAENGELVEYGQPLFLLKTNK